MTCRKGEGMFRMPTPVADLSGRQVLRSFQVTRTGQGFEQACMRWNYSLQVSGDLKRNGSDALCLLFEDLRCDLGQL
jgi:hypothetical protein